MNESAALFDDARKLAADNAQLRAEVDTLRARIALLERLADTDIVTPLPNRRAFTREVTRAVQSYARHATPAAVVFVDIDAMKAINDAWGHGAGDAALRHVAAILCREVRGTDMVARIGGDEFGLLLDRLDERAAAAKAAALLREIAAAPLDLGRVTIDVGLSLGLAMITADDTVESVLARADCQMYAAKTQRSDK